MPNPTIRVLCADDHRLMREGIARIVGVGIIIFVLVLMSSSGTYVVHPGYRGVEVTMGKVTAMPKKEGFGFKAPLITRVENVSIRQQTAEDQAECYSADLQQIHIELRVLYRIPKARWSSSIKATMAIPSKASSPRASMRR